MLSPLGLRYKILDRLSLANFLSTLTIHSFFSCYKIPCLELPKSILNTEGYGTHTHRYRETKKKGVELWLNTSDNDPFDLVVQKGMRERGRGKREVPYRVGAVVRGAPPAPSVPAPVAAPPAATAPATTPRWLAVVVPVAVSVLAGGPTAVLIVSHVLTGLLRPSFSGVQPLVQTAGFQVMPAVRGNTNTSQRRGLERLAPTSANLCYKDVRICWYWWSSPLFDTLSFSLLCIMFN